MPHLQQQLDAVPNTMRAGQAMRELKTGADEKNTRMNVPSHQQQLR